jgi:hypothetical protein
MAPLFHRAAARRRSARPRVALLIVLTTLPLLLLTALIAWRGARDAESRVEEDRHALAQAAALTVSSWLDAHMASLQTVARTPDVFEQNLIGSPATGGMFGGGTESSKAVQFDGFNGARFRDNTVHGFVDVKLHGHHHGSAYGASSHDHAGEATHESAESHDHGAGHEAMVDHSKRYHEVWVTGNTIHSTADYALRYDDVGHAANDRTAASETDERLNDPHVHFTRVHLVGNRLVGAGLVVQVFNATDDHHRGTRRGLVDVRANRIALGPSQFGDLFGGRDGIRVLQVIDAEVRVVGNVIEGTPREGLAASEMFRSFDGSAGIRLQTLDRASVYVDRNRVTQRAFGVAATQLTETVRWWVRGLSTSEVGQDVTYDDSVANPPNR